MTQMRRISADKTEKISVDPQYPRHPRSINPYTDVETVLNDVLNNKEGSR
jgi:hypothetical protein